MTDAYERMAKDINLPRTFMELSIKHPLRPIRSEGRYIYVQAIADKLTSLANMTDGQQAYFEVISMLMWTYEELHHPIIDQEEDTIEGYELPSWAVAQTIRETGLVEDMCKHGIGHPNQKWLAKHDYDGKLMMGIHGCDGCCRQKND